MTQSMACMVGSTAGLTLEGGLLSQGAANARSLSVRGNGSCSVAVRSNVAVSASVARDDEEATTTASSRRAMLSLLAATVAGTGFAKGAKALVDIKLEGPPPLSGGLPGTENSNEASNTDLDLKKRFYLTSVSPSAAVARIKDAVSEIVAVKSLIDKKAWPYVQNDLRSKAVYLGYDLKTIIDSKAKSDKASLVALKGKVFDSINRLDYAARSKSTPNAEKYYSETVDLLKKLVANLA